MCVCVQRERFSTSLHVLRIQVEPWVFPSIPSCRPRIGSSRPCLLPGNFRDDRPFKKQCYDRFHVSFKGCAVQSGKLAYAVGTVRGGILYPISLC